MNITVVNLSKITRVKTYNSSDGGSVADCDCSITVQWYKNRRITGQWYINKQWARRPC